MSEADVDLKPRVLCASGVHWGKESDAESRDTGEIPGDLVVQVITARAEEKSRNGAKAADKIVAHGRVVIVADGALEDRMRKRMFGPDEREQNHAAGKSEGKRQCDDANGPAQRIVGEDSGILRRHASGHRTSHE